MNPRVFLLLVCTLSVFGVQLQFIDSFATAGPPLVFVIPGGQTNQVWYSPYNTGTAPPAVSYFSTSDCIGGQRDVVLGHVAGNSTVGSVAICTVITSSRVGTVAFPLNYDGGAFYQWDGFDNTGTNPHPGGALNPTLTSDFDATIGGRAQGFVLACTADHDVRYYLTVINIGGLRNQLTFIQNSNEGTFETHILLFSDSRWSVPGYNFGVLRGIEVSVQTGVGLDAQAVDTAFQALYLFSYEISGNVILRCNCNSGDVDEQVFGEVMELRQTGQPTITTTTDVNGDYLFFGLDPGTYQVCIQDTGVLMCSTPSTNTRCQTIIVDDDPTTEAIVDFIETSPSVFTVPSTFIGDCSDCRIPDGTLNCPPYATLQGCLGDVTDVTQFTDVTQQTDCGIFITRTFENPTGGPDGVQLLSFLDTTGPIFDDFPVDFDQDCDSITTTFQQWLTADAFSTTLDDCGTSFVTDNWVALGSPVPSSCGTVTITFTPRDACGNNGIADTASFSLVDIDAPSIVNPASNPVVECSAKTTSVTTAFNNWLNRNGDFVASDTCSNVIYTNDLSDTISTTSCFDIVTVTFTATDSCGLDVDSIGTFTVEDTLSPRFTTLPQNRAVTCSSSVNLFDDIDTWANVNDGFARVTDDCIANDNNLVITNNLGTLDDIDECGDSIPVTFTVADPCGNPSTSATATWSVIDSTGPFFVDEPDDFVSECDVTSSINQDDYDFWLSSNGIDGVASDACSGSSVVWTHNGAGRMPAQTCLDSVVVTFTVTDSCGRSSPSDAVFTIRDITDPFFVDLPQDVSFECDSDVDDDFDQWIANNAFATAGDLCSITTITNTAGTNVLRGCDVDNIVFFTVEDDCGNASPSVSAVFNVVDTQPPVITSTGVPLNIDCDSDSFLTYNNWRSSIAGGGDAIDDCTSVFWTNDGPNSLTTDCIQSYDVTFTANDLCGNSDFFTQTALITDDEAPRLLSPAQDQDIQCNFISSPTSAQSYTNWLNANGFASAVDDCSSIVWTNNAPTIVSQPDLCFATAVVTFEAADQCGFFVDTTASFTVRDTAAPVLITPAVVETVQCDPSANSNQFLDYVLDNGRADAQDACSTLTWTPSFALEPFGCSTVDVTFVADDGCGSTITTTGTFTVIDSINPIITTPAQTVSVECDGAGNVDDYDAYVTSRGGAQATDVCALNLTWTNDALATGPIGCGSVSIRFTVTDTCGGSSTTTGTYRVVDTSAPTITVPAANQSAECDTATNPIQIASWLLSRAGAQATDTCYATDSLVWTNNFVGVTPLPCGAGATVTFTVTDPCAQFSRTTGSFTVTDSSAPVITQEASDVVFECDPATNDQQTLAYVNSRGGASAIDACSTVTWSNTFVATPDACTGPYFIDFIASDLCGNRVISTGSVTIDDSFAPEFVNFPPDRRVVCDEITDSSVTGIPGFTDDCTTQDVIRTESDTVEVLPFERLCPGDTIITRTWRLTDACGNFRERDQIILVSIPTGPCIPQECIPCDEQPLICCASSLAPVPCIPVECTSVECTHTSCSSVPCLPVTCGNAAPPPFEDDDDTIAPSPRPQASDCEPIYIYVFDDDDGEPPQYYYVTRNSSSSLSVMLVSILVALLILL